MKRMMGLMIYGGILFGLSAGGAWFLHSKHEEELAQERLKNAPDPDAALVPPTTAHPTVTHPQIPESQRQDVLSKVPVRPEAITAEEIVRHGINLKNRDEAVREREKALERVEAQYTLMLRDIEGEQREIEGLMVQAREQRKAADELLRKADARYQEAGKVMEQADARHSETEQLLEKAEKEQRDTGTPGSLTAAAVEQLAPSGPSAADREKNIKELTKVMQSMTPTVGAEIIGEFMDDGKTEIALQLIAGLDKAKAAEILDEMGQEEGGTEKVTELLEQFTEMSNTAQAAKKKSRR